MRERMPGSCSVYAGVRRARRVLIAASVALAAAGSPAAAGAPAKGAKDVRTPISLPAPRSFAEAVAAVEKATGAKGAAIETEGDPVPVEKGRSFEVPSRTAERLLAGSHARFLKAGFYLFRHERAFGVAGEKDRIGLVNTADRGEVIRLMGTGGSRKASVTADQIVAWLEGLAKEERFELTEIGTDYVYGRFERTPKDPAAVARRCAEFAPDLVAGRASTLDLLAEEIRANRTLYLIW